MLHIPFPAHFWSNFLHSATCHIHNVLPNHPCTQTAGLDDHWTNEKLKPESRLCNHDQIRNLTSSINFFLSTNCCLKTTVFLNFHTQKTTAPHVACQNSDSILEPPKPANYLKWTSKLLGCARERDFHEMHSNQTSWMTLEEMKRCWADSWWPKQRGHIWSQFLSMTFLFTKLSRVGILSLKILQIRILALGGILIFHIYSKSCQVSPAPPSCWIKW